MTTPLRCAIIGAGVISQRHAGVLADLAPEVAVAAVVDPDLGRAATRGKPLGATAYADLGSATAELDLDIAVVCTPSGVHADTAIEALRAGLHVVIEKPADIAVARIDQIADAQRASRTEVTVISQHRFDQATEIVADAITRGELGRLTSAVATVDWWRGESYYASGFGRGSWAVDGGGALMTQGVHTVDLLIALMGAPVEVFGYAEALAHSGIETEDVAAGVVRFASGAVAALHASTAAYPGLTTRLQIHGDRGSAVIENDQLVYLHATAAGTTAPEIALGGKGEGNQVGDLGPLDRNRDAMAAQYRNFIAAIRGREQVRVGLAENRAAVALDTGLYESARTGRPVRLDGGRPRSAEPAPAGALAGTGRSRTEA